MLLAVMPPVSWAESGASSNTVGSAKVALMMQTRYCMVSSPSGGSWAQAKYLVKHFEYDKRVIFGNPRIHSKHITSVHANWGMQAKTKKVSRSHPHKWRRGQQYGVKVWLTGAVGIGASHTCWVW